MPNPRKVEAELEKALEDSFPASDPPSQSQPVRPGKGEKKIVELEDRDSEEDYEEEDTAENGDAGD